MRATVASDHRRFAAAMAAVAGGGAAPGLAENQRPALKIGRRARSEWPFSACAADSRARLAVSQSSAGLIPCAPSVVR